MCPPLSCCHHRFRGQLPTQLYYLGRLLLASSTDELPPTPSYRPELEARMDQLWDQVQHAVEYRCRGTSAQALDLTAQLLATLVNNECCCRALQQAVPLAEAMGRWYTDPSLVTSGGSMATPHTGHYTLGKEAI